ncbi:MAG: sigma-70 family RNA polymerase sigma factor [Patescibacteria group bacterium]|nr:sigma-70 family RNA polymerase sigma factor [Patescibacteria group bacterium]
MSSIPAVDDDLPLVIQAQKGDYSAFETLVAKYERRVFSLARRVLGRQHDAEEVVQQTFLSLIEHIGGFRRESRFSTWLLRVATNHALALLRREAVRRTIPLAEDRSTDGDLPRPQYIAQWKETPEEIASRRETRQLLDEALAEIDEKHRLVFILRDIEGLSTEETARTLDISISNAKVRLLRARLMLRERLTQAFGDEATRVTPGHRH